MLYLSSTVLVQFAFLNNDVFLGQHGPILGQHVQQGHDFGTKRPKSKYGQHGQKGQNMGQGKQRKFWG